jgi:hypothetical protein
VLPQANAYAMIGRRAAAAGIATKLGNHSSLDSRVRARIIGSLPRFLANRSRKRIRGLRNP